MKIAGIDNSLNSPAITIFELDEENDCKVLAKEYYNIICDKPKKKDPDDYYKDKDNIITLRGYKDFYDRIGRKNVMIVDLLTDCEYVAIEDYSFSSVGSTYQIGENSGLLKYMLYLDDKSIRYYDPNSIKMFFSNNGSSNKYQMFEKYMQLNNPLNLSEKLLTIGLEAVEEFKRTGKKKSFNPVEDIVDSYAICDLLYTEIRLRKGLIEMKSLSEKQIQVFNKIHKDTKTNILNTDFIQKV
jgi:hypothetical protein